MIYFIKSARGRIKIGTTIRLKQRLKELETGHGEPLEVLAVAEVAARSKIGSRAGGFPRPRRSMFWPGCWLGIVPRRRPRRKPMSFFCIIGKVNP